MFFKFNPFSGSVSQSSQMAAYNPGGIQPHTAKEHMFQFESSKIKTVREQGSAVGGRVAGQPSQPLAAVTGPSSLKPTESGKVLGVVPNNPGYMRIMQLQKIFTKDDGRLVWMKRGSRDMIPYYFTMGLCALGFFMAGQNLLQMSFPSLKKKD